MWSLPDESLLDKSTPDEQLQAKLDQLKTEGYTQKYQFDLYLVTLHDWSEDTRHRVERLFRQYRRRTKDFYTHGMDLIKKAQALHNQVWDSSFEYMSFISELNESSPDIESTTNSLEAQLDSLKQNFEKMQQGISQEREKLEKLKEEVQDILNKFNELLGLNNLHLPLYKESTLLPAEEGNVYHPTFICHIR